MIRVICLLLILVFADSSLAQQPPNIVIIETDDQRTDSLSVMPNLTARMTQSGTRFNNHYCPTALCAPSRASLFTSMYAHAHGITINSGTSLMPSLEPLTFAKQMHDAGWRTGLMGKYINEFKAADVNNPYIPQGYDCFVAFDARSINFYVDYYQTEYWNGVNAPLSYHKGYLQYSTDLLANRAAQFINESEANDAQPWLLIVCPCAPHLPHTPAQRYSTAFNSLAPNRPPNFNEADVTDKPAIYKNKPLLAAANISSNDATRKNYYRTLLAVDDLVATIFNALDACGENGQSDDTVVIYTSDNGYEFGEHRLTACKATEFEEASRIPLWVYDSRDPSLAQVSALTSTLDIAPTCLEVAGIPIPSYMRGTSLAQPGHSAIMLENWVNTGARYEGVVSSDGLKYLKRSGIPGSSVSNAPSLYDLLLDPYELQSQHANPSYAQQMSQLEAIRLILRGE